MMDAPEPSWPSLSSPGSPRIRLPLREAKAGGSILCDTGLRAVKGQKTTAQENPQERLPELLQRFFGRCGPGTDHAG